MVNDHRELILNYSDKFEFIIKNSKLKKGLFSRTSPFDHDLTFITTNTIFYL